MVKNIFLKRKELSICRKLKFCNKYIFAILWCKSLIFQTWIIFPNGIYSLKYLRSTTMDCKDIANIKSEFVTKTQFLVNKSMPESIISFSSLF